MLTLRARGPHTYRIALGALAVLAAAGMLAGCGKSGSSGTKPQTSASGNGCAPLAGSTLVVLTDDKHLQNADNVIPAINAKAAKPDLIAALNKVSAALDTSTLMQLNKATDVDHHSSPEVAAGFAQATNLTSGITKGAGGTIKIGAANFSENQTLAELYKIVLTAAGYTATVQTIGNRELYEPALEKGQIQVVPEYAATLANFLGPKVNGASAPLPASGDLDKTVAALKTLGQKRGLVFGDPSQALDANAFAVTKTLADKYHLTTLSDFAAKCSGKNTVLAGPAECPQRPFCQLGLQQTYGMSFGRFQAFDLGNPTNTALKNGTATIGLVLSTDGSLAAG